MDAQWVREREAQCTQEQPPACTATCPLHVDARALAGKVGAGDLQGGLALLARHTPFPQLLARLCDHPCVAACRRGEAGEPVRIGALERACADHGGTAPARPRPAARGKRVAVVGGGLSGLAAAAELAGKGWQVEVLEAGAALLPRLRALPEQRLPRWALEADLRALERLGVEVRLEAPVGGRGGPELQVLLAERDAVYLGAGAGPLPWPPAGLELGPEGRLRIAPVTFATSHPKLFAGGTHRYAPEPWSALRSLSDGLFAALSIDRLLQGASITARREGQGPTGTRLHVRTQGRPPSAAVAPADPARGYSPAEAAQEAARCLPCQCLLCVEACEYLAHYKSYPRRYVREIYNNDSIVMGAHQSNRMVNSCTLCGLCAEACPERLAMGEVCLEARRSMVAKGKMPPSAHEFALQDLAFSQGEAFALARHEPGKDRSAALFFPGCQLSGSAPDQALAAWRRLRGELEGGVGIWLGCCGVPASWAGRQAAFEAHLGAVRETWERMGRPRLITACSSCLRSFREALPAVPVESLWTALGPGGPAAPGAAPPRRLALHDPCSSRGDGAVHAAVRAHLKRAGVEVEELDGPGLTTCCGFGGLAMFANPEVAGKIARRRAAQSPADYVTYCAMCRDSLAREGKRSLHLLDLLLAPAGAGDPAGRPDPGFSQRREGRARLKARLLREEYHEEVPEEEAPVELEIAPEVMALLERRMILLEDVRKVIEQAERTGQRLEDPRSGHLLASHRPVEVTYWVEYSPAGRGFRVHGAYSHRMKVS
jgi:Fe-S oxidoreductase